MKKVTVKARKNEYEHIIHTIDPETKERKAKVEKVVSWTPEVTGLGYIRELSVDETNDTMAIEISDEDYEKCKDAVIEEIL